MIYIICQKAASNAPKGATIGNMGVLKTHNEIFELDAWGWVLSLLRPLKLAVKLNWLWELG
jgi:hypothetical protein